MKKQKSKVKVTKAQRAAVIDTLTLDEVVANAVKAGVNLTVSLKPKEAFPNDTIEVKFLESEALRHNERASNLRLVPENHFNARGHALEESLGWAYGVAAATLRCYLNGKLTVKPPQAVERISAEEWKHRYEASEDAKESWDLIDFVHEVQANVMLSKGELSKPATGLPSEVVKVINCADADLQGMLQRLEFGIEASTEDIEAATASRSYIATVLKTYGYSPINRPLEPKESSAERRAVIHGTYCKLNVMRLQDNYNNIEEFNRYDEAYGLYKRFTKGGFEPYADSDERTLWKANPYYTVDINHGNKIQIVRKNSTGRWVRAKLSPEGEIV